MSQVLELFVGSAACVCCNIEPRPARHTANRRNYDFYHISELGVPERKVLRLLKET